MPQNENYQDVVKQNHIGHSDDSNNLVIHTPSDMTNGSNMDFPWFIQEDRPQNFQWVENLTPRTGTGFNNTFQTFPLGRSIWTAIVPILGFDSSIPLAHPN